ncbi:periplasmic chaperone for outer membrane proteins Skp [Balneicella halophila]|uniref:Periplasmic chaperone for outer membrane proteins Skp n=1 Tax=Balneicella halophila TaxID=1537566 RepID=A0A7L4US99_BALHA|nr:OmpH family outer membrane protein [Balneicella halophila]PVX52352.1 periplasmic chaperone for outer membrane proteins Skp [Balneicella halophila]
MKKLLVFLITFVSISFVYAQQRYVFVDTEYILSNTPEYQLAQDALNNLAKDYQEEIDLKFAEVKELKSQMESEEVFLSPEMREKRIKNIKEKEYQVQKLQQLYFGANGELYKKRQSLIQPVQEKIYQAVEELARTGNYGMVIDQAAAPVILWSQPKYDKSDKIIEMMLGKGVKIED